MPIHVESSTFVNPVTLEELKEHLNLSTASSANDAELKLHLDAAYRAIAKRIGPLVHTSYTERAEANVNGRLVLTHTPVAYLTTLTTVTGAVARDVDTVTVDEMSGVVSGAAGWRLTGGYTVEYVAGHAAEILPDHKLAVLYVAEHLWEMQQGSGVGDRPGVYGDTVPTGEESARYIYRGFALPRRALELNSGDEQLGFA